MARCRKRHVQVELAFHRRGGARRGSGRRRLAPRPRVPHRTRAAFSARHPLHVTLRVLDGVGRLRRRVAYRAVRQALLVVAPRPDFRVVHASVQGNHIHLVCEADHRLALARGVQAFKTSLARRLDRALGRTGPVFEDRYHVEVLESVRQTRNAICYVLNNWRKHGEHRGTSWRVDPFSTGVRFAGWAEGKILSPWGRGSGPPVRDDELLPSATPRTWLLAEGWRRAPSISVDEVPGPR